MSCYPEFGLCADFMQKYAVMDGYFAEYLNGENVSSHLN